MMKRILLLTLLFFSSIVNGQCDNFFEWGEYGTAAAPSAGNTNTFATDSWMGEYSTLTGTVIGQEYTFTIGYGGCVTLRTTSGALIAFGTSPFVWTATQAGTIEVHWNTDCGSCGINSSGTLTTVTNTTVVGPPVNDDCAGAISLTPNALCVTTAGNTNNATDSGVGCATGNEDDDVWYQFTATSTTHTVTVDGAANFDPVVAVYTSCAAITSPSGGACTNATGTDGIEELDLTGLTIGATYYVKLHDSAAGGGDFTICVHNPAVNDECSEAITLTPGVTCSSTAGNSDGGTDSGVGCTTGNEDDDVWYQFVATSANHTVTVTGSANFNAVAAVYTSCAATSSPSGGACSSPSGNNATLTLSCLTIGDTYYIKVHDYAAGGGDFSICVTTITTPPQDCENAVQICSNDAFNYNSNGSGCIQELDAIIASPLYYGTCQPFGSGQGVVGSAYFNTNFASTLATCEATYGAGNCVLNGIGTVWCGGSDYAGYYEYYVNTPGANTGCLVSGENQSSWYYATVEIGGTFIFELDPVDAANDYDFAVWGPYTSATAAANCSPIEAPIRCSWNAAGGVTGLLTGEIDNSEGAWGGNSFVAPINANAGDVYIIMVDNFSAANSGYDFNWTGTAVIGCTPVVLPVELDDFQGYNKGKINKLNWRTSSEMNNDHFELERSDDGISWYKIAEIDGNGTTSEVSNYAFNDYGFRNVINHYRLTQVDINGSREVSNSIAIDNRLEAKELVKIINTLGQEVRPDSKGLKIYIYSDGTIVKRMN